MIKLCNGIINLPNGILKIKRDFPWRDQNDPYKNWLSEIILQQTRVVTGIPFYLKFINKYPNVKKLANADEKF